jgi:hypothetical protein
VCVFHTTPPHVFATTVGFFTSIAATAEAAAAAATACMSADEVTPAVPAAAAQEQRAQSRKKWRLARVGASNEERTALVVQVYVL